MGRWAQYRTRGRAASPEPDGFPLEPPVFESQWTFAGTDPGAIAVSMDVACPAGADGFFSQYRVHGTEDWVNGLVCTCGDVSQVDSGLDPGEYDVRVRWQADNTTPLSDWSTVEGTTVS